MSTTCWVALHGSPEIKGFTDLNEACCCHLNRTPSDLARWTKMIPIPHPYYSSPSNHGFFIGASHIFIVFVEAQYVWIGGLIQNLLDASPSNWHTFRHHSTPLTERQAGVKQGCLICAWWRWVLSPGWRLMICEGIIPNRLGAGGNLLQERGIPMNQPIEREGFWTLLKRI